MPLTALLVKNINVFCFTSIIKRPPSTRPSTSSDDLHRPFPSSWLPLYLKKFSSLKLSTLMAATNSDLKSDISSASTFDYDGDVEAEVETSTPDLSSVYTSPRFFVSSPGLSKSILDSASFTSVEEAAEVEVQTESPDPYSDFRRSMEEMVEARDLHDVPANWESLQELLRRYLSLNPEPNHKFIAGAFADLLVSLMSTPVTDGGGGVGVSAGAGCSASY